MKKRESEKVGGGIERLSMKLKKWRLKTETKVRSQKKIRHYLGIFPNMGGEGLPNSQNFCKSTKYFFVCQIHSEVLKHVLQRGDGDI